MRYVVVLFLLLAACGGEVQDPSPATESDPEDSVATPDSSDVAARYAELMAFARENNLRERPIGEIIQALGERFKGSPYLTGPLDGFGREVLVCRLDGFDCFTFVEAVLAASRGVAVGDSSSSGYVARTREQRYRDGVMGDYCSRLHYYTEWIADNEEKGIVRNITKEIGGVKKEKKYSFMAEHRDSYPMMAENDSIFECIEQVEDRLNKTMEYYYIPQDDIHLAYPQMRAGDLIATATDIDGLDVTHTGFVYKGEDGSTGLLHASTTGGVKISPDLEEYVQGVKSQIGIIVSRAIQP